jgi:hypothetical protein
MRAWNVYLGKTWLTRVYYDKDCDADYVRSSLIDHDGYFPSITVRRA